MSPEVPIPKSSKSPSPQPKSPSPQVPNPRPEVPTHQVPKSPILKSPLKSPSPQANTPFPGQCHQLQVTKSQISIPPEYPKSKSPSPSSPFQSPPSVQSQSPITKSHLLYSAGCKCRLKSPLESPPSHQVPKFR